MNQISKLPVDKLALAKEMYILGCYNGSKDTRTNRMLAILNFDFSVVTIIITSCIYKNVEVKSKQGRSKKWDELISGFKTFYNNTPMISDLKSLHEVRNMIQHGGSVPSEFDIKNYQQKIREFFDDVCKSVYEDKLNYDTISIASVLKSDNERLLLQRVERYFENKDYNLALQFIGTVLLYHYLLIQENLGSPFVEHYTGFGGLSLDGSMQDTETPRRIAMVINRLAMGEYYIRLKEILSSLGIDLEHNSPYFWIGSEISPKIIDINTVKGFLETTYNIILGTEHNITEKYDLEKPLICGLHILKITTHSCTISYFLFSKYNIQDITISFPKTSDDNRTMPEAGELSKNTGYNEYTIEGLQPDNKYVCVVSVKQKSKPNEWTFHSHSAEIIIKTKPIEPAIQKL